MIITDKIDIIDGFSGFGDEEIWGSSILEMSYKDLVNTALKTENIFSKMYELHPICNPSDTICSKASIDKNCGPCA